MQPSDQDVQAVAQYNNGGVPVQQPAPAPQPVAQPDYTPGIQNVPNYQPAQQPQPQAQPLAQPNVDPFASLQLNDAPTGNTPQMQPQAQPPVAPVATEVGQPQVQQPQTPQEQQPQAQPQQQTPPAELSYDQRVDQILSGIQAPEIPDLKKVNYESPEEVEKFFADYGEALVARAAAQMEKKSTFQNLETQEWNKALTAFPTLKDNAELRNMVHNIRVGNHQRGIFQTPTQAAQELLKALGQQYNQGVVDNQVQTTIENVQPLGGAAQAPTNVPITSTQQELLQVQDGGTQALEDILNRKIAAGQL